jgi:phenylalanyl-tRNA synthetase beta chain
LAGVMGGEESGVTLASTEVFLESAFFSPAAISGRARRYGFSSDASHRFERGVDFALAAQAMERATELILRICGGKAGPIVEAVAHADLPQRVAVPLRPARVRRLLGLALSDDEIVALLRRVHLEVSSEGGAYTVRGPSYRFDIEIEEDLVEEVARLHGYDNMPAVEPRGLLSMLPQTEQSRSPWAVRHLLAGRDFQEVVNYAFVDESWEQQLAGNPDPIRLANPIASQMGVMRSNLIGSLVSNVVTNRRRQTARVRVFEVGRCFLRDPAGSPVEGYHQPLRLAALAAGPALPEQWGSPTRSVDFFDLKGDLEALFVPRPLEFRPVTHPALHPGRAAEVMLNGQPIGVIGELHPRWVQLHELGPAPVVFEVNMDAAIGARLPNYLPISRMPGVVRDLALVMPARQAAGAVLAGLKAAAPTIVSAIDLFDEYHGKGIEPDKKSLAFRVLLQDTQRTLEESEVEAAMDVLIQHASQAYGAQLRG